MPIDIQGLADLAFILQILFILLQTKKARAGHIKVLTDLVLLFLLISIDIKGFQTFAPHAQAAPILHILFILAILLQTTKKARREKTNPPARNPCKRG